MFDSGSKNKRRISLESTSDLQLPLLAVVYRIRILESNPTGY